MDLYIVQERKEIVLCGLFERSEERYIRERFEQSEYSFFFRLIIVYSMQSYIDDCKLFNRSEKIKGLKLSPDYSDLYAFMDEIVEDSRHLVELEPGEMIVPVHRLKDAVKSLGEAGRIWSEEMHRVIKLFNDTIEKEKKEKEKKEKDK